MMSCAGVLWRGRDWRRHGSRDFYNLTAEHQLPTAILSVVDGRQSLSQAMNRALETDSAFRTRH